MFARSGDNREGDYAANPAELRHFAHAYRDRNVYVAPNPTCSTAGARHTAAEVTHWSFFLIDMDPICTCPKDRVEKKLPKCVTCRGKADPRAALEEALLWFGEWLGRDFGPKGVRPIIIDSGRGMQAWIRLEDVVLESDLGRRAARKINGYWLQKLDEKLGLLHGCRIDTSVSDLPRVMRCPGTVNLKTGRETRLTEASPVIHKGLAKLMTVAVPIRKLEEPDAPEGVAAGQPWQAVFSHLTLMAQNYLKYGQEEPGRHKVMWHTAKKFQELGVSRQEAGKALRWANKLKGPNAELPKEHVKHALDTAYGA